jgi:hypothetical protein
MRFRADKVECCTENLLSLHTKYLARSAVTWVLSGRSSVLKVLLELISTNRQAKIS